jgi:ankyrin repeat protein
LLLQRGASADHRNDVGIGAAYIAAERGNAEVLQLLLEHGSDARLCTVNDVTLLMVAARSGDADTCQLLLRHGADIHARDKGGCTALSYAIESGKRSGSVVRCLLGAGADPNGKEGSFKPLLLACYYGCYNERYSRPTSLDEDPMTETIQTLLAAGADPADLNLFWSTEKRPAIDFAREVRAPQIIRQLEEAMAS